MVSTIYGKHAVESLLSKFPEQAKKLWFTQDQLPKSIQDLVKPLAELPVQQTHTLDLRQRFNIKEFESHQGILLELKTEIEQFLRISLEDLIIESSFNGKPILWLPTILDGHNLGAVIRSAVALGQIAGLIIPSQGSVALNRAVAKVSSGALFSTKFAFASANKQTIKSFTNNGIKIVTLENVAGSVQLTDVNFEKLNPFVLVIGAEDIGVPQIISDMATCKVKIAQTTEVESLNLSVATGITLYEIARQKSLTSPLVE